ncbi:MAG: hypothetical protein QW343_03925 [Candidatus Norongarragalinales archaeon]
MKFKQTLIVFCSVVFLVFLAVAATGCLQEKTINDSEPTPPAPPSEEWTKQGFASATPAVGAQTMEEPPAPPAAPN